MKYNGKPMHELVQRSDWQNLRESFLETWKDHAPENVKRLRGFLGPTNKADVDKLLIVYNYLTGTGFRLGIISDPTITKLRTEVKLEIAKRKESGDIVVTN